MIGRQVARLAQATIASADYVRERGLPCTLAELQHGHVVVNWASPTTRREEPLAFMVGKRRREVALPFRITASGADA